MTRYEFLEKWGLIVPSDKKEELEKDFLSVLLGKNINSRTNTRELVTDYNDDLG